MFFNILWSVVFFNDITAISGTIYQYNEIGKSPVIHFSTSLSGGKEECTTFAAQGNLSAVITEFTFTPTANEVLATAKDFLISLYMYDSLWNEQECVHMGGYNSRKSTCKYYSQWNEPTWDTSASGFYNSTVAFDYNLHLFQGGRRNNGWRVCVGNGWNGAVDRISYLGRIFLYGDDYLVGPTLITSAPTPPPSPSPTAVIPSSHAPTHAPSRAPTPSPSVSIQPTPPPNFQVASSVCGSPLSVDMSLSLRGYEQRCLSVQAEGSLHTASLTMDFARHTGGLQTPSDAGLIVFNTGNSRGVQIGGYSYVDDSVAGNRAVWPSDWGSLASSSSNAASVNISAYGVGSSAGYYRVCMVNGYKQAGSVRYSGSIALSGLQVACSPSPEPTPQPTRMPITPGAILLKDTTDLGDTVRILFNGSMRGGDYSCLSVASAGSWAGVQLSLNFQGEGPAAWASDFLIAVSTHDECLHIGGSSVDHSLPSCEFKTYWPSRFDSSRGGDYSASLAWSSSPDGTGGYDLREVCLLTSYCLI